MKRKETEAKMAEAKLKADSTRRISEIEAAHTAIEGRFREATVSLAQTRQRLLDAEKAKADKTRAAEEATRMAERLQVSPHPPFNTRITLIFLHSGLAILALSTQWQFSSHAHFLTRVIHTLFLLLVQLNTVDSLLLCVRHLTPAACDLAMTSTGGERSKDGEARGREARGGVTTRRGLG
jgi:hypothetical protein